MPYRSAKIYNDGSHYIAIPQTDNPTKRKKSPTMTVCTDTELQTKTNKTEKTATETLTPKERFEKIYRENNGKRKAEKIEILTKELKQDFKTEEQTREFIERNLERLQRNKIVRKTRLARKINLNEWNWFCTFTYSNEKHTEDSFRKGLPDVLKRMVHRKGWKYIGVWERGGETNRLHFHGIFYIPENGMPGELEQRSDYSFGSRKRQMIMQNTYFNDKFGRNDFNELSLRREITDSARYLMKYIEKSGEKLIYSRNIPTYFRSDIMDEDVLCTIGQEDKKLLLSDDFNCWDEGCLIGKVSPEVIREMPKCKEKLNEERTTLKLLEKEMKQTQTALDNMIKAIERDIMSDSTNKRLHELETQIKDLDERIAVEQNKVAFALTEDDIRRYYLTALKQEPQLLINCLVKEITLYDDKMIIIYNTPLNEGSDENRGFSFYEKMLYLPYTVPQSGQTISVPIYAIMKV